MRAITQLLTEDRFTRIRSGAELAELVTETVASTPSPYSELMRGLIGLDPSVDEGLARALWMAAVEHKRSLSSALGRDVLLRVAMLDLLSTSPDLKKVKGPVLLTRRLLGGALRQLTTDELTGLVRRDEFVSLVAHELRQRSKLPPVLAYIDVDDFKSVNDRHGHSAGDRVLRRLGEILRSHGRASDVFARVGGDEFAALFVECGLTAARAVVERVQSAFRQEVKGLSVALSVGLVVARAGESSAELIRRADERMYGVKRRQQSSASRAARGRRARVAVSLLGDLTAHHEVHAAMAKRGCLVIPTQKLEVAQALVGLLSPAIVVVGETREADAWLKSLTAREPRITCMRLLPEGAPHVGTVHGELVIQGPLAARAASGMLRLAVGNVGAACAPLAGPRDANRLIVGIERMMAGTLTPAAARAVGDRPELDLVKRHLGA